MLYNHFMINCFYRTDFTELFFQTYKKAIKYEEKFFDETYTTFSIILPVKLVD